MAAIEFCCLICDHIYHANTLDLPCPNCGSFSYTRTNLDADDPDPPLFTDEEADAFLDSLGLDPEAFNKEHRCDSPPASDEDSSPSPRSPP